ncbi:MAG: hypothetical protein HUU29_05340 [Planctomycetaceae bacterium]|nr:hypothetical protein [Planctomycetaceae bacterium]
MGRKKWIIIFCFLFLGLSALFILHCGPGLVLLVSHIAWEEEEHPWVQCSFDLPEGLGVLTYYQRQYHPFLAEYDREVSIMRSGVTTPRASLTWNTGGRTNIAVYWVEKVGDDGPYVRLFDRFGEIDIDVNTGRVYLNIRQGEKLYSGELLAEDVERALSVTTSSHSPPETAGKRCQLVSGNREKTDHRKLGTIDGQSAPLRFVPATVASSQPVAESAK